MGSPELSSIRARSLQRGVNPVLYRTARLVLVPFFRVYFRLDSTGAEHIPARGAAIVAANHRSFLDPFVLGALARRPVYYMAKRELFERPLQARLLSGLGAFPVDRGAGDEQAIATARQLLERGECVVIFPEGTRIRRGPLAAPRRGVGRLVLQSGVPVVPVALIGTERARRGWRVRPCKVAVRCGRPLRYPIAETPSPRIALGVAERIWACVSVQWQWLGGEMPQLERGGAKEQARRGGVEEHATRGGAGEHARRGGAEEHTRRGGVEEHATRRGVEEHATRGGVEEHATRRGVEEHVTRRGAEVERRAARAA